MEEIQVPPYFLCPISLEIMKDPVTLSTGITYDRENIEKWIFSVKNNFCPVTKQVLTNTDLTPNITLRRMIQAWCTVNASHGIERFPTPKPPISRAQIAKLLTEAKCPQSQSKCLKKLTSMSSHSETNKRCIESAGAAEFLASIIINGNQDQREASDSFCELTTSSSTTGEALSLLHQLKLSEPSLKSLLNTKNGEFVQALIRVMQRGNFESRAYAIMILRAVYEHADPMQLTSLKHDLFAEVVGVLKDQISQKASKSALQLLVDVCPWGRNRIKAVEAGAVPVIIDLLLESPERRTCEMLLVVLDQLCQCAEGRAELLKHGAGIAVVSKRILRVSQVASERGVRILNSVSKFSATPKVLQEMLQLGVVAKLCLVLQVECGNKTKEKAREILKMHAREWRNSPCIPVNYISSYPC